MEENQKIKTMEEKLQKIYENVELMLSAIRGNKLTMDGGMVQDIKNLEIHIDNMDKRINTRFEGHEKRLDKLEMFSAKVGWTIFITVSACASIGSIITLVIAYLSLKK